MYVPLFAPVTSVDIPDGKELFDDAIMITPPPPGDVAGALMYAVPEDGPLM